MSPSVLPDISTASATEEGVIYSSSQEKYILTTDLEAMHLSIVC